jgi:hypothetical protein
MAGRNEIELLITAHDQASAALAKVGAEIKNLEGGAAGAGNAFAGMEQKSQGALSRILDFTVGMTAANLATAALSKAWDLTVGSMQKGLQSIDDLRLAQASMAAAASSNDQSKSFENLYQISGRIVEKVYELDRAFIGTGDELLQLADSMVTFGMGIDLTTEKAQKQFVGFANMLKMMTKGQDFQRQAYQEVRALMEGADVQGAMLVKKLEAAGVNVKQMVPAWREQGILLEKIMEFLPGYIQASGKIEMSLGAQKSSLETIAFKILREGMAPAYEQIMYWVKDINDSLLDQNGLTERGAKIVEGLSAIWTVLSGAILAVGAILENVILPILSRISDVMKKGAEAYGSAFNAGATGMDVWGATQPEEYSEAAAQREENERDKALRKVMSSGEMKLSGGGKKPEEDKGALKAAESLAKKMEDLYDKIAVDRARERGGEVAAAFESARIERINTIRSAEEKAKEAGTPEAKADLARIVALAEEIEKNKQIKALEKERDEANKEILKKVKEREKAEKAAADLIAKQNENLQTSLDKYEEMARYASEMKPRIWDVAGVKDQEKAVHDLELEMNRLDKQLRKKEITSEGYDQAVAALTVAHKAKLAQIKDANDTVAKRLEELWADTFSAINNSFQDIFLDGMRGKFKSFTDYMDMFTDSIRQVWSKLLAGMLTDWLENQAKMSFSPGGQGASGLSTLLSWGTKALGMFSGAGAATGAATTGWEGTAGNSALAMDTQHQGMFGLREGGILAGSFVPIRAFAAGGIVSRPTLGMVGEGGDHEAVIPLKGGAVPVKISGKKEGTVNQVTNVSFNITAADTKDFDRLLMERRLMISGMIRGELQNAGGMRDSIRRNTF